EKHNILPYEVKRTFKGSELVGKSYEPLFENRNSPENGNAHKVWDADYVSVEDGTGIVHLAPAYGEEDYNLSKEKGFPFVSIIDENGFYTEGEWKGQNVWEVNKPIAKALKERGIVWKIEYIVHSYPHCYRCGTRLMYRAHPSWFMDIDGQKQLMLEQNENINWFPEHIKHGRFQKTVETAPDWNISRDRFWATAMPVWKGTDAEGKEHIKVVGSYAELKELSGEELADYHRPWVDDIEFDLEGVHYTRIDKVMDCWFESGSMPFAQHHYPFENVEKFEKTFPGDFIVEYVGQVRAWFYYLHAVNVGLFGHNAFKNVITTGIVAGNDGRKMSKSYGNYTDPNELMDKFSADSLRFLLMSSPVMNAEDFALQDNDVGDVARKLSMVWNMYDFFTMYAEVDKWEWDGTFEDPSDSLTNPLDIWIVSRVHQLTQEIQENMDRYDIPNAVKPILPFLDDASNWYVRRSRRRFWKSEDDGDKNDAYRTLHYVLLQLSHVLAPVTPFLAEELFLKLTGGKLGESVHLRDWPKPGKVDEQLVSEMAILRELITEGLSQRAEEKIKVRQPLRMAEIRHKNAKVFERFEDILQEELNVKMVLLNEQTTVAGDDPEKFVIEMVTELDDELKREGMMREVVRQVQSARKQAGLNVDDRIKLELDTHNEELAQSIEEYSGTIAAETLAIELITVGTAPAEGFMVDVNIDGAELAIALSKA
ncbi:MAG: ileS, partial [Brevundimonas sp.]|nr:ileS [Brevundimonas sp.]